MVALVVLLWSCNLLNWTTSDCYVLLLFRCGYHFHIILNLAVLSIRFALYVFHEYLKGNMHDPGKKVTYLLTIVWYIYWQSDISIDISITFKIISLKNILYDTWQMVWQNQRRSQSLCKYLKWWALQQYLATFHR